jgi:hypothetical protein
MKPPEKEGVRACRCPSCGYRIDAATCITPGSENHFPEDGDFTLCGYCGDILRFKGGRLRAIAPSEIFDATPRARSVLTRGQELIREFHGRRQRS